MGGVFSSSNQGQKLVPLNTNDKVVCMKEVERLNNDIEKMIKQCSEEKLLIKSKYGVADPNSVSIASCNAVFKYYGNHVQTFNLLQSRFKDKNNSV